MPVIVPFTQGTTAWPASLPTHATPTTNRIQQHSSQSLRTPTSNTRTPKNRNGAGDDETGSQCQGTPFNSLLTAARSMMVDGVFDDYDEDARTEGELHLVRTPWIHIRLHGPDIKSIHPSLH
ncbi:hypothetical protein QCA50_000733 [Cerrena zonata]|uniref:Uncharacterized protein n=1 Tax=Cerrena zonata TaxID=2478898 RepID=A0AAW0GS73_9APHY